MKSMKSILIAAIILAGLVLAVSCASSGGGGSAARGPVGVWTFDDPNDETGGWYLVNAEFYQYKGTAKLSRDDKTFGNGMLRLDVDFTGHKDIEWSEVKIANDFPKSINMKGIDMFVFDFYYNPSLCTTGSFKPKIWSNNGSKFINESGFDIEGDKDMGNGFVKAFVQIAIVPGGGFIPDMRFGIAGCLTDYKGPIFIDNIKWVEKK
jgi:mannan endo-1,4-beta-mannosidase